MDKGQEIYDKLLKRGVPAPNAAILVGSMKQESGFNPGAWNAKEKAGGLIQWRNDRLENLLSFAKERGSKPGDTDTQLDFLVHEMTLGSESKAGGKFLEAGTDPETLNKALKGYIRWGDDSDATRLANAKPFFVVQPAGEGATGQAEFSDEDLDAMMNGPAEAAAPDTTKAQPIPAPIATPQAENPALAGLPAWVTGKQATEDVSDDQIDAFMNGGGDAAGDGDAPAATSKAGQTDIAMTPGAPAVAQAAPVVPQTVNTGEKGNFGEGPIAPDLAAPFVQDLTMGASDEILAGIAAPLMSVKNRLTGEGPTAIGENYDQARALALAQLESTKREAPIASTVAGLVGAVATPLGIVGNTAKAVVKAPTIAKKVVEAVKGAALGSSLGAAYGFNTGEGTENRLTQAKEGAVTGAFIGAVAPTVVNAGVRAARGVKDFFKAFDPFLGKAGEKRIANRLVDDALGDADAMANGAEIIPGSVPTLAESSGSAKMANLQRQIYDRNPELFVQREAAQNEARAGFIANLQGTEADLVRMEKAASDQADNLITQSFQPGAVVDASPAVAKIDSILAGPSGGSTAVKSSMTNLRNMLIDDAGNLVSKDPEYLYQSVRKEIKRLSDGVADPNGKYAKGELKEVRKVLDDVIESGAPGFKQYLKAHTDAMQPINAMRYLQSLNLFNAGEKVTLGKVDSALNAIAKARKSPGTNEAKSLTKDQIGQLQDLKADLLRSQNANLGKAKGSNTNQNLMATDALSHALPFVGNKLSQASPEAVGRTLGGAAGFMIVGPATGGLNAVGGAAVGQELGGRVGKLISGVAQRKNSKVLDEVENLLLNPANVTRKRRKNIPVNRLTRAAIAGGTVGNSRLTAE